MKNEEKEFLLVKAKTTIEIRMMQSVSMLAKYHIRLYFFLVLLGETITQTDINKDSYWLTFNKLDNEIG